MGMSKETQKTMDFLFSKQNIIDLEYYEDFYKILNRRSEFRHQLVHQKHLEFITLEKCLEIMGNKSYA
jgi:hypothetical protein